MLPQPRHLIHTFHGQTLQCPQFYHRHQTVGDVFEEVPGAELLLPLDLFIGRVPAADFGQAVALTTACQAAPLTDGKQVKAEGFSEGHSLAVKVFPKSAHLLRRFGSHPNTAPPTASLTRFSTPRVLISCLTLRMFAAVVKIMADTPVTLAPVLTASSTNVLASTSMPRSQTSQLLTHRKAATILRLKGWQSSSIFLKITRPLRCAA
jgi:hypothetical protein